MSFDPVSAAALVAPQEAQVTQVGYGATMTDAVQFQNALHVAGAQAPSGLGGPEALAPAMKGIFNQLEFVNGQASNLAAHAKAAEAKGAAITPGEMIGLTVQCHEFMFNCQLTSNIANRTSDGLQQLFRQQA
ncbi:MULTISPECIES: hypothetical protein [Caulobacter]|jgi:hypothetical protein|uniref:Flagellar hook-basal body complex protein FliE n=1 Tax=Caulobacter rhizosphaerae TaxID=2010972 RepID=A0ABU1N250_9CAUL|nr:MULTISPECIES: hypothetical protein [Caulobacter]KQZ29084.1 hypothetical protein ASD47_20390 [Caulobacter sp. Root1472]MDR6532533.1 hypothetical protein [Caulobacter rhizosphaerae]GGL11158.1 hypothetical protein GCM10010983_05420 [Caulobacter rhizosphaerae]